ncbi:MAG TPA: hypothetical protein VJV75_00305 [Candidatus Polarisedimenticolia bacterium]|nr:hypothetical protein [Candidatus Polarisedimenticolia bacterium]
MFVPDRARLPALVLVMFGALAGCRAAPTAPVGEVEVRMLAADTAWQATYLVERPDGVPTEIPTGREVHVPVGAEVVLALASRDYISEFALAGLGLRDFAAPGLPSEFRFRAERRGRFALRGDELCGRPHTDKARGWLVVEEPAAFRAWFERRAQGATG